MCRTWAFANDPVAAELIDATLLGNYHFVSEHECDEERSIVGSFHDIAEWGAGFRSQYLIFYWDRLSEMGKKYVMDFASSHRHNIIFLIDDDYHNAQFHPLLSDGNCHHDQSLCEYLMNTLTLGSLPLPKIQDTSFNRKLIHWFLEHTKGTVRFFFENNLDSTNLAHPLPQNIGTLNLSELFELDNDDHLLIAAMFYLSKMPSSYDCVVLLNRLADLNESIIDSIETLVPIVFGHDVEEALYHLKPCRYSDLGLIVYQYAGIFDGDSFVRLVEELLEIDCVTSSQDWYQMLYRSPIWDWGHAEPWAILVRYFNEVYRRPDAKNLVIETAELCETLFQSLRGNELF